MINLGKLQPSQLVSKMLMFQELKKFSPDEIYDIRPDVITEVEESVNAEWVDIKYINWEFCIFSLPNSEFNQLLIRLHEVRNKKEEELTKLAV